MQINNISLRGSRVSLPYGAPLPRRNEKHTHTTEDEKYEVVIVGAGTAGIMLETLLAHYGLSDQSLLCIDSKPGRVRTGQADGLQPRTLEVLKSMGLVDPIMQDGCHLWEMAIWKPSKDHIIERLSLSDILPSHSRYEQAVTISQGVIEQVFESDLTYYSERGVQRNSKLVDVSVDEPGDADFPVVATIETDGVTRTVRSKFLVGADGAHSTVRKCIGVQLVGESIDDFWGVIDFVADSNFPDIRRFGRIHSHKGTLMIIPREQTVDGEYLTRLYVQMPEQELSEAAGPPVSGSNGNYSNGKSRKSQITVEDIIRQASRVFEPYYIRPKVEGVTDWWTVYQIGQRIADRFIIKDSKDMSRIFLIGDSCHTHSPKAGQGMNVSMMDAHNLSWKLAYAIQGLSPDIPGANNPSALLASYEVERYNIAQQLIDFDKRYSSAFSKRSVAGEEELAETALKKNLVTLEESMEFASGCGVEYGESCIIHRTLPDRYRDPISGTNYFQGILRSGRRLSNVIVKRFADGSHRDLQDDFLSNGRFRILCLTSTDLLDPDGISAKALRSICSNVLPLFPASLVETVVLYPRLSRTFEWTCLAEEVKQMSEMRFYSGYEPQDAYGIYGVDPAEGALVAVRPDGYVGVIARTDDVQRLRGYLEGCIRKI
ncbi:hypothetical protein FQN49_001942 [Arthroderma sp. PD_2]|nr:hypothetical protein FQN49_001942 [Arthroderma sp. PD_2]